MSEEILTAHDGDALIITFNRPDKKNAITGAMYTAMAEAVRSADDDDAVAAIIFASNGPVFTAGNDLQDFVANPPGEGKSPVREFLEAISQANKPLLSAIQGPAVGVGATMQLHCDYVVAARSANLQFGFVKVGLVPEAASSLLLPRIVGRLRASEIMFTGDPVEAEEAHTLGLVSKVVDDGDELEAAKAFAARLAKMAPQALAHTKALLKSETIGVPERMAEEGTIFAAQLKGTEFMEAVGAFMQKREPVFRKTA
ncbi:MAG: enoyl-CoA hydratase-related protein [Pseudomonadota bacterium]